MRCPSKKPRVWTLAPESRTVSVPKEKAVQRVLFTGLSRRDGALALSIDGGQEQQNEAVHEGWTERNVILEMPRTNRPVAYQLRTPNVSAGLLEARAIVMKQDLDQGLHTLTLKNIGDAPLHFRLLLETDKDSLKMQKHSNGHLRRWNEAKYFNDADGLSTQLRRTSITTAVSQVKLEPVSVGQDLDSRTLECSESRSSMASSKP